MCKKSIGRLLTISTGFFIGKLKRLISDRSFLRDLELPPVARGKQIGNPKICKRKAAAEENKNIPHKCLIVRYLSGNNADKNRTGKYNIGDFADSRCSWPQSYIVLLQIAFLCLNNQQAMGRYTVLSESPIGDFCRQISPLNLHFEWILSGNLHLFFC